eukprot:scaffold24483_cov53-Phaeocystis_antarctica.AAC.1
MATGGWYAAPAAVPAAAAGGAGGARPGWSCGRGRACDATSGASGASPKWSLPSKPSMRAGVLPRAGPRAAPRRGTSEGSAITSGALGLKVLGLRIPPGAYGSALAAVACPE